MNSTVQPRFHLLTMFIGLCIPIFFSLDRIAGVGSLYPYYFGRSLYPYYFGLSIIAEIALLFYFSMRLYRSNNPFNVFVAIALLMVIPVIVAPYFTRPGTTSSLLTIWMLTTFAAVFPALPIILVPGPLLVIPVIGFITLLVTPYRHQLNSNMVQIAFIIYLVVTAFFVYIWGSTYSRWHFTRADTLATEAHLFYADVHYHPFSGNTALILRECSLQGWGCREVFEQYDQRSV